MDNNCFSIITVHWGLLQKHALTTCCPILDEKNSEDCQIGQGCRPSTRNFLNPIISKLDKHVVLFLINYITSKNI